MLSMRSFILTLACSSVARFQVQANDLVSVMIEYEQMLYSLRTKVLQYRSNCAFTCASNAPGVTIDTQCAIDACQSSLKHHPSSGLAKTANFGSDESCGDCKNASRLLDFKHSTVTNADIGYKKIETSERSDLACWTGQLDKDWAQSVDKSHMSWQYFGTPLGLHRTFPGYAQKTCSTYDPRLRPWYVAATTGPKDVVIVIDTSGSMSQQNRINLAKEAAESVVSTLTILDRFNVVQFSSQSSSLNHATDLVRATAANKQHAIEAIQKLVPTGQTNMQAAFDRAFKLFKDSATHELTAGCHRVLLFLTDGEPSGGKSGSQLEAHVRDLNAKENVTVFTYSLGSGAAKALPKNIACQNNGIWTPVADGTTSLRTQMSYYYDYIATLRDSATSVVWVEPYIDAFGGGKMTTASLAVYDNSTVPATLVGVLGMDIIVSEMEKLEPNHEKFLKMFIRRSVPQCPKLKSMSECQLEVLRQKDYAKLDPEYIGVGVTATSEDRTCKNAGTENCKIPPIYKICNTTFRAADWCQPMRTDFKDEACFEVCAFKSGAATLNHLHPTFIYFTTLLTVFLVIYLI